MTEAQEVLLARIRESINTSGQIGIVDGAFGDMQNCGGVLEETKVIGTEVYTKFYGCSYLFKGFPDKTVVEGLSLAKAMISGLPREIIAKDLPMLLALAFTLVFRRKKFIHIAHVWFSAIYANEIEKLSVKPDCYCIPVKELRRAVYARLKGNEVHDLLHRDFNARNKEELDELIANITEFICIFIELDSAYRFRFQDALAELKKENVKKDVVKELRRIFTIVLERENGMPDKMKNLAKLCILFLRLSRKARNWARDFFLELDIEKVKLDEADWYFCLQRDNYRFGGISLADRLKEKERLDQEKGHIILKLIPTPQGMDINV